MNESCILIIPLGLGTWSVDRRSHDEAGIRGCCALTVSWIFLPPASWLNQAALTHLGSRFHPDPPTPLPSLPPLSKCLFA